MELSKKFIIYASIKIDNIIFNSQKKILKLITCNMLNKTLKERYHV